MKPEFSRLALITGNKTLEKLENTKVIVFGLGGVGSWCAEALVRSGLGTIALVDSDLVCVTNINRQVQATTQTIGLKKTEALKDHLAKINPDCKIIPITKVFCKENECDFDICTYEFVIDAIDSLSNKLDLIEFCLAHNKTIFSCMGMAQKLDPTKIKTGSIWKTIGCPLAKLVRAGLRKRGFNPIVPCSRMPSDFEVVYSEERLPLQSGVSVGCGTGRCLCPECGSEDAQVTENKIEWCAMKKVINGSAVTVTASAGMVLASLVLQNLCKK
ncbi:MAG: tRNA threonylcarbamoyladenosine dehydratase [Termitinemataceae bacterium]|nr:MAG: tRNA threonylcarbamoyladenosine dehydratase [Termitinemataceae bacterium]